MSDTGWKSPGTVVDSDVVGTLTWADPNYAKVNDSNYAYVMTLTGGGTVSSIKIVKGGSISGNGKSDSSTITSTPTYYPYGTSTDLWGLSWTTSDINSSTFGVAISVTGSGGTSHYLKATNFGFSIPSGATIEGIVAEFELADNDFNTFLDHIRITIYYTESAGTPTVGVKYPLPAFSV